MRLTRRQRWLVGVLAIIIALDVAALVFGLLDMPRSIALVALAAFSLAAYVALGVGMALSFRRPRQR